MATYRKRRSKTGAITYTGSPGLAAGYYYSATGFGSNSRPSKRT